jgi:PAS domain S-box-containing protein
LIFTAFAIFSAALVFQRGAEQERLAFLVESEGQQKVDFFENILKLEGSSLETLAYDYTYWDEMVSFVATKDETWAEENIKEALYSYRANAAWVYDAVYSPVYAVSNLDDIDGPEAVSLSGPDIRSLFKESKFCHFFIDTPSGLFEIRGATIHPTYDVKRETPPYGYFLVGRLWDEKYIYGLSELTGQEITVVPVAQTGLSFRADASEKYKIYFSKTLNSWDNSAMVLLNMSSESKGMKNFDRSARYISFMFITCIMIVLLIILISLTYWVTGPLGLITAALTKENPGYIDKLSNKKGEFGNIARLIKKFFEQKKALTGEICKREKIETELKEKESYLTVILNSLPVAMVIIDHETHVIIEANPASVKMIGAGKDQIIGKTCYQYICTAQKGKCPFSDLGRNIEGSERMLVKADGSMIPILGTIALVTLNGRKYILESFMDITDRKKAEERQKALLKGLEDMNKIMIGRELKMIELKKEINILSQEIGKPAPYDDTFLKENG